MSLWGWKCPGDSKTIWVMVEQASVRRGGPPVEPSRLRVQRASDMPVSLDSPGRALVALLLPVPIF